MLSGPPRSGGPCGRGGSSPLSGRGAASPPERRSCDLLSLLLPPECCSAGGGGEAATGAAAGAGAGAGPAAGPAGASLCGEGAGAGLAGAGAAGAGAGEASLGAARLAVGWTAVTWADSAEEETAGRPPFSWQGSLIQADLEQTEACVARVMHLSAVGETELPGALVSCRLHVQPLRTKLRASWQHVSEGTGDLSTTAWKSASLSAMYASAWARKYSTNCWHDSPCSARPLPGHPPGCPYPAFGPSPRPARDLCCQRRAARLVEGRASRQPRAQLYLRN